MRLTRRGIVVLAVAVPLLAFGFWGGYPMLRALGAVLLGAVLAAVLLTARRRPVEVRRSVYPERVERGRPALASLRVRNPGGGRRSGFVATDAAGGATRTVRVRALAAGAEAVHHYELPTAVRGRLTVGPLTLHGVDPFGLARGEPHVGESATLWVHPRQFPTRAPMAGYPRHHHEGPTDGALRGSAQLLDVREYVPGDEVRHLHWKATARTGRLMVRDLADPEQPRFTLLLDTRPAPLTAAEFEEAVDLAASLLGAAARAGHHTRLVTSAGLDLVVAGGAPAARRLLDELCELGRDDVRAAGLVPPSLATSGPAGGCLVAVTAGETPLAVLTALRHRFPMIVVIVLGRTGDGSGRPSGESPAEPEPARRRPDAATRCRVLHADSAEQAVRRWNETLG
ncbi:hypothetical protein GCM10022225_63680 [Plantactinospora mayteni]|uniref:DUF58 domain-containing protein n=1 Tax=Plantactinospora mayteni TaxID=566021 RepID=A0ABQ4F068_9ACTN|nr:DUF58 domain-containing protein [Plantactinospora mayteni]GIH00297.1 hypothetical protein Pma05_68690 [Plantactinospora mayteni]